MNNNELTKLFESFNETQVKNIKLSKDKSDLQSKLILKKDSLYIEKHGFFELIRLKKEINKIETELKNLAYEIRDNKQTLHELTIKIEQSIMNIDNINTNEEDKKNFINKCIHSFGYLLDDVIEFPKVIDTFVKYANINELQHLCFKTKHSLDYEKYKLCIESIVKYNRLNDDVWLLTKDYDIETASTIFDSKYTDKIIKDNDHLYELRDVINAYYRRILDKSDLIIEKINKRINEEPKKNIINYFSISISNKAYNSKWMNDYSDIIFKIFDEVVKNENINYSDIHELGNGSYAKVFEVGNKVIKIGKRKNYTFKDNPYIVKPLLRKNFDGIVVEVTEKVDTQMRVNESELYELYSNLRDMGIIWTDIKSHNVGRLLKDNTYNWNSTLNDSSIARELKEKENNIILKKGDLVLIDADYLFEDENNIELPVGDHEKELYYSFKKRYETGNINFENDNEILSKEEAKTRRI